MNEVILETLKADLAKMRPSDFILLSKETGVPEGTIRKIHYGESADPRISTVQKLRDHFAAQRRKRGRRG